MSAPATQQGFYFTLTEEAVIGLSQIKDLYLLDNTLYAAAGNDGLNIFTVIDPGNPQLESSVSFVSEYSTEVVTSVVAIDNLNLEMNGQNMHTMAVTIAGGRLYLINSSRADLLNIEVNIGENLPGLIRERQLPAGLTAKAVQYYGNWVGINCNRGSESSLLIMDIGNENFEILQRFDLTGKIADFALDGKSAYVLRGQVFEVRDLRTAGLEVVSSYALGATGTYLCLKDNKALISTSQGLTCLDLEDLVHPKKIFTLPGAFTAADFLGGLIMAGENGFTSLLDNTGQTPSMISYYPESANKIILKGDTAYLGGAGLHILFIPVNNLSATQIIDDQTLGTKTLAVELSLEEPLADSEFTLLNAQGEVITTATTQENPISFDLTGQTGEITLKVLTGDDPFLEGDELAGPIIRKIALAVEKEGPVIDEITPGSGPIDTVNRIAVRGRKFSPESELLIGQSPATVVEVIDHGDGSLTLVADLPVFMVEGPQPVELIDFESGLSDVAFGGFVFYLPLCRPQDVIIEPSTVEASGGELITVYGNGFGANIGLALNNQSVPVKEIKDVHTLTFQVPQGPPGILDLTITSTYAGRITIPGALDRQDRILPSIVSITPENGGSNVPVSATIQVRFSEKIKLPQQPEQAVILTDLIENQPVAATIVLEGDGKGLTLTPDEHLTINKKYRVEIKNLITDLYGNPLTTPSTTSTFYTVDTVNPTITLVNDSDEALPDSVNLQLGQSYTIYTRVLDNLAVDRVVFTTASGQWTDNSAPFSHTVTAPASEQDISLTATVYDKQGLTASDSLTLHVYKPLDPMPVVKITSPDGSFTIDEGVSFISTVEVQDDQGINKVEFLAGRAENDLTLIATASGTTGSSVKTYQFSHKAPFVTQDTPYILKAVVEDSAHQIAQDLITITLKVDSIAPSLTIASPADHSIFVEGSTIPITVGVTDNKDITSVSVSVRIGTEQTDRTFDHPPYRFDYTLPQVLNEPISMEVTAQARDAHNNTAAASSQVTIINDSQSPTVVLTSPNASFKYQEGRRISLCAEAFDDHKIRQVEFMVDDQPVGVVMIPPYRLDYDLGLIDMAEKVVTIQARAEDTGGNQAVDSIFIKVVEDTQAITQVSLKTFPAADAIMAGSRFEFAAETRIDDINEKTSHIKAIITKRDGSQDEGIYPVNRTNSIFVPLEAESISLTARLVDLAGNEHTLEKAIQVKSLFSSLQPESLPAYTQARSMAVFGDKIYVARGAQGLGVYREEDLLPLGAIPLPGSVENMVIRPGRAYLACGEVGVIIVDLTMGFEERLIDLDEDGVDDRIIGQYQTSGYACDLAIHDQVLAIADGDLTLVSMEDEHQPTFMSRTVTAGETNRVRFMGSLVLGLSGEQGLSLIDCFDPTKPVLQNLPYTLRGPVFDALVCGIEALIATGQGLKVIQVDAQNKPIVLGSTSDVSFGLAGLSRIGSLVLANNSHTGFSCVDISQMSYPQVSGLFDNFGIISQLLPYKNYLYLVGDQGLGRLALRTDDELPSLTLNAPQVICPRGLLDLMAQVSEAGAPVTVEFLVDDKPLAGRTFEPFTYLEHLPFGVAAGDTIIVTARLTNLNREQSTATASIQIGEDVSPPEITRIIAPVEAYCGQTITVSALAEDNQGLASVTFSLDGQDLIPADASYPYQIEIPLPEQGTEVTISASALDLAGLYSPVKSREIILKPDTHPLAPEVFIIEPQEGQSFIERQSVQIVASAMDDGKIEYVAFTINNVVIGYDTTIPYTFDWQIPRIEGYRSVKVGAVAYDSTGNQTEALPVSININDDIQPPVVSLTTYPSGRISGGSILTVNAAASDDRALSRLTTNILIDGLLVKSGEEKLNILIPSMAKAVRVEAMAVDFAGNCATASADLTVMPTAAIGSEIGSLDTMGSVHQAALQGNLLYLAEGDQGIGIFNLENPAGPVLSARVATLGEAGGIQMLGGLLLVADGPAGLSMIDLDRQELISSYPTIGKAKKVAAIGHTAVVLEEGYGLEIFDFSDPLNLFPLGDLATTDPKRFVFTGQTLYLADGQGGIKKIDVTDLSRPTIINERATAEPAQEVIFYGEKVVLICDQHLEILDKDLNLLSSLAVGELNNGAARLGHTLFVADGLGALHSLDLSSSPPVLTGSLPLEGQATEVTIGHRVIVVSSGPDGLRLIDFAGREETEIVTSLPGSKGTVSSLAIAGQTAYLASGYMGIQYVDLSSPYHPEILATVSTSTGTDNKKVVDVAVYGNYLFAANGFSGLDIINNSSKKLEKSITTLGSVKGVQVYENRLYALGSGVSILDISDPGNPRTILANYNTPGTNQGIDLKRQNTPVGIRLIGLVADGQEGLTLLDLTDPTVPIEIGSVTLADIEVKDVVVAGEYAYLACGTSGLAVVDIRDIYSRRQ